MEWRLNDKTTWGSFSEKEWYGITRSNNRNDTIYIRVTDNVGNVSNIESTVLKIDNIAPSAPVITNSQNNVWNKEAVTVSMKSTDSRSGINRYEWYENGGWTTRAITIKDGVGTIKYTAERNETIRIRAVDNAGNVSSESTTIVKIDTTNPTAKISASVKQNSITVSASGSSDTNSGIASYQYSKDNKTWYTSTSSSYTFTGLSAGSYTVYVKVTDNSGRTSSVVSTKATVASDNIIYDTGTANSAYKTYVKTSDQSIGTSTVSFGTSYIYMNAFSVKAVVFTKAISNNYRYLKITAKTSKNSTYGTYYKTQFGIKSDTTFDEDAVPLNAIKRFYIINYSDSSKLTNYTSYTTFTLDLSSVTNSSYYIYLYNCDTTAYIQKIWLTNTA